MPAPLRSFTGLIVFFITVTVGRYTKHASPARREAVSQCHSEALAEESLIRNILISLDSSLRSE